ncbi:MAG: hypothetical protein EA379_07590 [Phycisphaerales bacterium]|nr:MAG: hypothetical protein EA379_07590 [Phycisphaerales bacterium]
MSTKQPAAASEDEDTVQTARKIEEESPEGRPAQSDLRGVGIGKMIVGVALAIVLVGVILAFAWDRTFGVAIAVLGVLAMAFNPAVWGSLLRASEREKIADGEN